MVSTEEVELVRVEISSKKPETKKKGSDGIGRRTVDYQRAQKKWGSAGS